MVCDCHTHPLGHEGGSYSADRLRPFIEQALAKGLTGLGFTDHDWYVQEINYEVISFLRELYPDFDVLLGLEVDYAPHKEKFIRKMINSQPFDYIVGSVHELDGWMFDHPDYREEYQRRNIEEIYRQYFQLLEQAVASGLFQVIGHLDLIKVFGYRTRVDILELTEPLLQNIKDYGLVVEVNTNGLYKPVNEIYPQKAILQKCHELKIPLALSSDAHQPQTVGRDFDLAKDLLRELGYDTLAYYKQGILRWQMF